ncbi:MAG: site-specific integrase [bacterium]
MSVFKRSNKWCIGYSLNGRWVRKIIGSSKKVAELAERDIRLKIAKGKYLGIVEQKISFEGLCKIYLEFSKANKTAQSHRRDIVSIKNLLITFNARLIFKISALDLEHYMNKRRIKVAPATVNRELSCIKHMFNKAVQWGYLLENPLRSVVKFKEPPGRTRYLTKKEIAKLLSYCAYHVGPIVVTALNTGMRKGEILNLKWRDIDMKNRVIIVRNSKNNESRTIPINDRLLQQLKVIGPELENQYVFSHSDGSQYRDIRGGYKGAVKRAGLIDVTFHTLRHTFASHLVMNGVPILEVQKLLGHKTLSMTMRYSHLSNKNLRDAASLIKIKSTRSNITILLHN